MWLNPAWALVSAIPFTGVFQTFTPVPLVRIALAIALQLVNSFIAAMLLRAYEADAHNRPVWLARFTALQFLVGAGWGIMVWLLWVNADVPNRSDWVIALFTSRNK